MDYDQPPDKKLGGLFTLYIFLGCPKCGATGQRKMYFNPISFLGQQALTDENVKLVFGRGSEALQKKQLQ